MLMILVRSSSRGHSFGCRFHSSSSSSMERVLSTETGCRDSGRYPKRPIRTTCLVFTFPSVGMSHGDVASFVPQNTIISSRTRPSPRRLLLLLMSVVANFADTPKALPGRAYFSRKILTEPKFWCHAYTRLHLLGGGTTVRRPVEDVPNR